MFSREVSFYVHYHFSCHVCDFSWYLFFQLLLRRILFFRDGISDGNFGQADIEIQSIRQAAEESIGQSIPISKYICFSA